MNSDIEFALVGPPTYTYPEDEVETQRFARVVHNGAPGQTVPESADALPVRTSESKQTTADLVDA